MPRSALWHYGKLHALALAKVVTQTGNQGSASSNLRRSIELIQAGVLGQVSNVHVWHPAHGWPNGGARPAGEDTVPKGMNWDFWCGPSPLRPYKAGVYHPGKWRGWYDFGNGSVGDFCCHSFNMPVRALNLKYPGEVRISKVEKAGFETYAKAVTHTFHFPAEGKRAAVNLIYYTGGVDMPPSHITDAMIGTFGSVPRVGAVVEAENGLLSSGLWNSQCYVKLNDEKKFVGAGNHSEAKKIAQTLPRANGHFREWTDAILDGGKTFAPFEIGGHLTEIGLSGIVALKLAFTATWPAVVDGTLAKPAPRSLIVLNSGFESHSTRYFSTLWPPDSTGGAQATPSRRISAMARVTNAALELSPNPSPADAPAAIAMTFFSAPPNSTPIGSPLVYTRNVGR